MKLRQDIKDSLKLKNIKGTIPMRVIIIPIDTNFLASTLSESLPTIGEKTAWNSDCTSKI